MNKVVSYSLWGTNPKYTLGAVRNAEQLKEYYPDWKAKFYVDATTPRGIVYELQSHKNVVVVQRPEVGDWRSMFWRFEASFDDNADVVIFRDTDCRLGHREVAAVDEWLASDKLFHIMRDHPYHKFPVLGGMWGVKKNERYDLKNLILEFYRNKSANRYGTDYEFFITTLYPLIKNDSLEHDEFFKSIFHNAVPFPVQRSSSGPLYVGEPYNGDDSLSNPEHRGLFKNEN
tara:strand:- start:120 stop:809 length:690 start_codon:yes stop_codon:yes gene_type:complete